MFGRTSLWFIMLEQQLVDALSLGCAYVLFALGFTLVFGILGVVNLPHDAIFMLDAYATLRAVLHFELPLWAALAAGFVVSGAVGLIIDMLLLRSLRRHNAPHPISMIVTIGAGIAINNAMQGVFGAENLHFPTGLVPDVSLDPGGIYLTSLELNIIVLSSALMAVFMLLLKCTQLGRVLHAIAESPKAIVLLGISVEDLLLLTSFTATVLGGLSGVLIGLYSNVVFLLIGQPTLYKDIAVIILDGLGNIRGTALGGLFLRFAGVLSVAYIGSTMRDTVALGLLFLILLVWPQGLFDKVLGRKT